MKFNLLILLLVSIESFQTRKDELGYAKKYIIKKEINDFSESIYDICVYYESFLQTNNMSICNVMYQFFFPLKLLFTRKILSINEFNYNSGILPLKFYYNGNYISSNYANKEMLFVTKQDVLRKKKNDVLSQVNKKIIEFLVPYGYNEINDDLTDNSQKGIELFEVGIKIVRHCLENNKCIDNLLKNYLDPTINKESYMIELMSLTDNIPSQQQINENSLNLEMFNQKIRNELEGTLEYNSLFENEVYLQNSYNSDADNSWCVIILGWFGLSRYAHYC